MKQEDKGKGLRYNEGKRMLDLIPVSLTDGVGKVLTYGANKYAKRDWEKGMPWLEVIGCLKRHLSAFERGEDFDDGEGGTGLLHMEHVACNVAFLLEYYKTYPEGDDRVVPYLSPKRIGLDIDEVLCDFAGGFSKWAKAKKVVPHWNYTYEVRRLFNKLPLSFWKNLEPLMKGEDFPFEPAVYITHRPVSVELVEDWLYKHNFPCVPVEVVRNGDKIEMCKKHKVDIFVDDKYENFVQLNNAGIFTYLWDRPHNRKYDVGYRRLKSMEDLVWKS